MADRKLIAIAPNGEKITRRTPRNYTHVVVSRGWAVPARIRFLTIQRDQCLKSVVQYRATIERQGHADSLHTYGGVTTVIGNYNEYIAKLEPEASQTDEQIRERAEREAAAAEFGATWHQRLDLAQKEYSKRLLQDQDVSIVTVEGN